MVVRSVLARVRSVVPAAAALAALVTCGSACGKGTLAGGPESAPGSSVDLETAGEDSPPEPLTPRESALWAAAAEEDEASIRLVDLVGCQVVRERAAQAELRTTAIRALGHCGDFSELPWLVRVASQGSDSEARAALESVDELAAQRRRATDPEDGSELHDGCTGLLALARTTALPRERRVLAIRGLRMLSERGCVKRSDIPKDLDAPAMTK